MSVFDSLRKSARGRTRPAGNLCVNDRCRRLRTDAAAKRQLCFGRKQAEKPVQQSVELVGPWHLDKEKNDLAAFADSLDLFPGYGEWGAAMEIQSDGQINWYIGAESWHGIYTTEHGVIHARLTSDLEQSTRLWDFRIVAEKETAQLEMDYKDMTIYWVYGDREESENGTDKDE